MTITPQSSPRIAAPCPWCGAGTRLSIAGDGLGGSFVGCTRCGARGPAVAIDGDFAASDEIAIRSWSTRAMPFGRPGVTATDPGFHAMLLDADDPAAPLQSSAAAFLRRAPAPAPLSRSG